MFLSTALENAHKVSEEHSPEKEAGHGIVFFNENRNSLGNWTGEYFHVISVGSHFHQQKIILLIWVWVIMLCDPAQGDDCIMQSQFHNTGQFTLWLPLPSYICPGLCSPLSHILKFLFKVSELVLATKERQYWCSLLCCIGSKISAAIWQEDGEKPLYATQNIVYAIFYIENSTKHLFYQEKKRYKNSICSNKYCI